MEKPILCLCLTFLLQQTGCEQFVNIALLKTPTQDGTLKDSTGTWDVSHSVDGLTECTPVDGQHYSGTADGKTPWWQLDLGSIYTIKAIHLLGRPDTPLQLGGFRLWAGLDIDHLSMMYNANDTAYNNGSIWVNMTIKARVIKLDLPRDITAGRVANGPLTLCEVKVLICSPGYYGPNCLEKCGQCINGNTTCVSADGTCQDGCAPGYNHTDRTCHTKCQAGYYGFNCTETCGQCFAGNTSCSVVDGSCLSGCAPGYNLSADAKCNQECNSGYYGYKCTDTCGHCIDGNTACSVTDGTCQKGCAPGYYHTTNRLCNTSCHEGLYGLNCSMTCGLCLNGTTCLGLDGTCPAGCSPGYDYVANRTCTTKCRPGLYGLNCSEICGHCIETNTCNETDGACPTTCAYGFDYIVDRKCTTECANGTYGQDCLYACGSCSGGRTVCLKTNGFCPQGECSEGFTGKKCDEEISEISDVKTIVGVVVGIVVLLITAVGLVFVLKRRGWLFKR